MRTPRAFAAIAIASVTVFLPGLHLVAQNREPVLAFEVATIKLAPPNAVPKNQAIRVSPTRLSIPSMTLSWLVYAAYGNGGFNTSMSVRGGPDWANKTAFAVEGLSAASATTEQHRLMLQALLAERFNLKLRHEEEMHEVLGLVVDRGQLGPKVKKWDGTCPATMPALYFQAARRPLDKVGDKFVVAPASPEDDPAVPYCPTGYRTSGGIRIDGATMVTVAEMLSLPPSRALLGGVTQDRTGLTDRFTLELDYAFPQGAPTAAGDLTESLADAVREQWGLRFVKDKGPLKVVVIESAQTPTEN